MSWESPTRKVLERWYPSDNKQRTGWRQEVPWPTEHGDRECGICEQQKATRTNGRGRTGPEDGGRTRIEKTVGRLISLWLFSSLDISDVKTVCLSRVFVIVMKGTLGAQGKAQCLGVTRKQSIGTECARNWAGNLKDPVTNLPAELGRKCDAEARWRDTCQLRCVLGQPATFTARFTQPRIVACLNFGARNFYAIADGSLSLL